MSNKDSKYELELAVNATNESDAIEKLSDIFGKEVENDISGKSFITRGDLFFTKHSFLSNQLSDEIYKRLKKNRNVLIMSDELSLERSAMLLKICLPVEVQLKKLLSYVYPSIIEVFDGKVDKKNRIELCKQINELTLGRLLKTMEIDMSVKKREDLFANNGGKLFDMLDNSTSFEEFRGKISSIIDSSTVWDQVCVVLDQAVEYNHIKGEFYSLLRMRNKAAHPQVILVSDIKRARKDATSVMRYIGHMKNNYEDELRKSIHNLEKVLGDVVRNYTPDISNILSECICNTPSISKSIEQIRASTQGFVPSAIKDAVKDINCAKNLDIEF